MVLVHHTLPKIKITSTHSGTDYQLESETVTTDVVLRENAVSYARLIANDYESSTFLTRCYQTDNLKIEFKYQDGDDTYTQLFGGWIEDLEPFASSKQGELVGITALGYGVALVNMLVRQEYGTQSENPTLNLIQEVLTDATYGIVPKYVDKVLATATNSGYSIDTTKVANLASNFKYLYFPGKPALKCLEDMVDLISAANAPGAGAHWIVVPDGTTAYLCVATVGVHENPPRDVWKAWFMGNDLTGQYPAEAACTAAGHHWQGNKCWDSTIEVNKDMVTSKFRLYPREANYVLFVGNFRRPANGDIWTNNNSGDWAVTGTCVVEDENGAGLFKIGTHSIRGRLPLAVNFGDFYYPSTVDLNLDVTKIGTERTIPRFGFYLRVNGNITRVGSPPIIKFGTGAKANNDYFYHRIDTELPADNEWGHLSYPIGPLYDLDQSSEWEWLVSNGPNWNDIDYVSFWIDGANPDGRMYVDGMYFQGIVTRAASDTTKIGTQKCKMLLVRDDVAKDDSLIDTDDSGQMGQLAKATLYRSVTTPLIGQIEIPLQETIKGGQLAHIHFGKKSDGSFEVDKDMRIIEARHHFSVPLGAKSYLTLTDDVKNSQPRQPMDDYNRVLLAVAPGFQDRVRGSMLAKDIDIGQTILVKNYAT